MCAQDIAFRYSFSKRNICKEIDFLTTIMQLTHHPDGGDDDNQP
jgi:hypothetical protein